MTQMLATVSETNRALATELCRILSSAAVVRSDEPLSKRTTLRVGGPADLFVEPGSEEDLSATLRFCAERQLKFMMLGRGSNLLVLDGGFRGVVISLGQPLFSGIISDGIRLVCGAGAKLKAIANEARRHSLTGLEFMEGIPGSLGGGLRMNAGAMGSALFDVVCSVRVMDYQGNISEHQPASMSVVYRCCPMLKNSIALQATLMGRAGQRDEIERRMQEYSRKRWTSQPPAPSAGCMFKNPVTVPAGRLIDELGLKGTRIGGALISLEHGNFIVNEKGASARDVCALIKLIKERAKRERDIDLETEVEIVGTDV